MITAAILLLGSCGSATRTIEVEPSIERIVLQVIIGGVKDVALPMWERVRSGEKGSPANAFYVSSLQNGWAVLARCSSSLRIDGRERTGIFAWLAAGNRVAGYALSKGTEGSAGVQQSSANRADAGTTGAGHGSVCYEYRLRIRGFDIRRATRIEDGHVSLVTDVYGAIGPRGELHHVSLTIAASEHGPATTITGTLMGHSRIGEKCRLINRIASRVISRELAKPLRTIERGGINLYRSADACLERLLPR